MSTTFDQRGVPRAAKPARPLVLAIACAAALGIFLVLPYVVNDLARLPLAEVASGQHDPKDLWPYIDSGAAGSAFGLGALLTLALAPVGSAIAAGWAAVNLWRERVSRSPRRIAVSMLALAFGVATIAWLASPMGSALLVWWAD